MSIPSPVYHSQVNKLMVGAENMCVNTDNQGDIDDMIISQNKDKHT